MIPKPIYMLNSMEVLKSLNLECNNPADGVSEKLNLSELVEVCLATLSALHIKQYNLTFNESTSSKLTSIQDLALYDIELTPTLIKIIEKSFPKLSKLDLRGTMTSNLTLSLPNHNLKEVTIDTLFQEHEECNGFAAKTINDGVEQYYAPKQTQWHIANGQFFSIIKLTSVSKEDFNDPLVFSFICASMDISHFNNFKDIYHC